MKHYEESWQLQEGELPPQQKALPQQRADNHCSHKKFHTNILSNSYHAIESWKLPVVSCLRSSFNILFSTLIRVHWFQMWSVNQMDTDILQSLKYTTTIASHSCPFIPPPFVPAAWVNIFMPVVLTSHVMSPVQTWYCFLRDQQVNKPKMHWGCIWEFDFAKFPTSRHILMFGVNTCPLCWILEIRSFRMHVRPEQ